MIDLSSEFVANLESRRADFRSDFGLAVSEGFAIEYHFDISSSYPKLFGDDLARQSRIIQTMDFGNVRIFQFGPSHSFSVAPCPMLDSIIGILLVSSPPQVFQVVIARVPIQVAAFHSFWAWANKRLKYEGMNLADSASTVFANLDGEVSSFYFPKFHHFARNKSAVSSNANPFIKGFEPAPIRDTVESLMAGGIPPVFVSVVRMDLNFLSQRNCGRLIVHDLGSSKAKGMKTGRRLQSSAPVTYSIRFPKLAKGKFAA